MNYANTTAGIPPKKVDHEETNIIIHHTWPFFDSKFPTAEHSTGASHVELRHKPETAVNKRMSLDMTHFLRMNGSNSALNRQDKRLSISADRSSSFGKDDPMPGGTVAAKGFKIFMPGDYIYNFEQAIDSRLPESINVELGHVKYELEAVVERPGVLNKNLSGTKEVMLIRTPAEGSLEQVEPIAISRNWDNQLHYDIVISGKSFPLGTQIPIAFKLTPLAKVQCHRIKVFLSESIDYYCAQRRVHRSESTRKLLLFEKRSDSQPTSTFPGSTMRITSGGGIAYDQRAAAARGEVVCGSEPTNLLGNLESPDAIVGPTEMEISVQLPTCADLSKADPKARIHFDTTYSNIKVHHWIKIVMRISRPDADKPGSRRHFEISIDSPFHILSCQATQANISLPAYSGLDPGLTNSSSQTCGCPGAPSALPHNSSFRPTPTQSASAARASSEFAANALLQPPAAAHVHGAVSPANTSALLQAPHGNPQFSRPMHIIRAPSYAPPAFDDEQPPPPMMTPPPMYNDIASPTSGLADYFARLSDSHATEEIDNVSPTELGATRVEPSVVSYNNTSSTSTIHPPISEVPIEVILPREYPSQSSSSSNSSSEESLFTMHAMHAINAINAAQKMDVDGEDDGHSAGGSTPRQRRSLNIEMPAPMATGPVIDVL